MISVVNLVWLPFIMPTDRLFCGWERREEEVSYIGMLVDANRSTQSGSPLTTCDQCVPDCQVLCSGWIYSVKELCPRASPTMRAAGSHKQNNHCLDKKSFFQKINILLWAHKILNCTHQHHLQLTRILMHHQNWLLSLFLNICFCYVLA
jgi:hypothetical protein